jgi:hypothetical protein
MIQVFRKPIKNLPVGGEVGCPSEAVSETSFPSVNAYSPVFCCGFGCGTFRTGSQSTYYHWEKAANNTAHEACLTFDSTLKRTGNYSLRFNQTAQEVQAVCSQFLTGYYPPYFQKYIVRIYLRFRTLPTSDTFLMFVSQASNSFTVGLAFKQSDSKLYAALSSNFTPSTFGASGAAVTTDVWYRIDLKIDFASGAKVVDAQVDGVALGGVTSSSTATDGLRFRLGSPTAITADFNFADCVISQTLADYPWGAGIVRTFIPRCDGVHNTGTSGTFRKGSGSGTIITNSTPDAFDLIDEIPLDDATPDTLDAIAQTLAGSTNYTEHRFGPIASENHPTVAPRAVEVLATYHQGGTGSGNSTIKLNDNGTENTVLATGQNSGVTTIRTARKHYKDPPSGLGGWKVDGQSGNFKQLKLRFGYSSDANPIQYLDGIIVEAEFPE